MKKCSKCKIKKNVDEFCKDKSKKDGLNRYCKDCNKEWKINNIEYVTEYYKEWSINNPKYSKQRHINNKLGYWVVYLLPNYNYVGITNNPIYRMYNHKSIYNRITDNWIELTRFNTKEEAQLFEAMKHSEGYNGKKGWQNNNRIFMLTK